MSNGFPTIKKASQSGETGVNIVSSIINDDLNWIFRRNYIDNDFGIDGYIDIVTEELQVTGKSIAIQIKHGESFFKTKNQIGYVFYGEEKHLNYYLNHQIPVIIILCKSRKESYWVLFDADKIQGTKSNWKITVPYRQQFGVSSKIELENLVGHIIDYRERIKANWKITSFMLQHESIYYCIDRSIIEKKDTKAVIVFLQKIVSNDDLCLKFKQKIDIKVSGYSEDARELWEIKEVKKFMKLLEPKFIFWIYFLDISNKYDNWLKTMILCIFDAKIVDKQDRIIKLTYNSKKCLDFLARSFDGLNELTHRLNMPDEENQRMTFELAELLGLKNPYK